MSPRPLVALALFTLACQRQQPAPKPHLATPVELGKALFEQGQLDAALAKLQEAASDPDSLYYQGAIWAKRAESAPLPTPPPPPSPMPRGSELPPAPEFKPEELEALGLFEKAVAAKPDHPKAHLGIAELLAPHAARLHDLEAAAAKKRPVHRGKGPEPTPTREPGPDYRPERVVQTYRMAARSDVTAKDPLEGLYRLALRVGRLDDADFALRELIGRDREKPEPLIRYGDFLVNDKKDPEAAVDQYRQALIWRADDDATRAKLADIFIAQGMDYYAKQQYALAEVRFKDALKFVTDRSSPQGLRVQDYIEKLAAIRQK